MPRNAYIGSHTYDKRADRLEVVVTMTRPGGTVVTFLFENADTDNVGRPEVSNSCSYAERRTAIQAAERYVKDLFSFPPSSGDESPEKSAQCDLPLAS